jgi:hypothetical protein
LKSFYRLLPSVSVLVFCVPFAQAQSAIDINIGFGGAWDSANKSGIDNANSTTNAFGSCSPGSGLSVAARVEQLLSGVWRRRDGQAEVYRPVQTKRAALNLEAEIGGARTSFS